MQILSSRWGVSFGAFTLNGRLTGDILDEVLLGSAQAFSIPARPDGEVKLAAPCGMFDPGGPVVGLRFLGENGDTWVGVGTRMLANSPNPALVEASFRTRAHNEIGENWSSAKKKRLNGLRKACRRDLAATTPFRLSESGALFVCLGTGEVVTVGQAGQAVCRDLVGRSAVLSRVAFTQPDKANAGKLLTILRRQEDSIIPWPTGSAALFRVRSEQKESCAVRMLSWAQNSTDAQDLLSQRWKPRKIELQWADERKGSLDLSGALSSVKWAGGIRVDDPQPAIETRLAMLLTMNSQATRLVAEATAPLLPMGE
jgi:hypothetical protein